MNSKTAERVAMQDADTVVYEYYAYNLNEEEYQNRSIDTTESL